MTSAINRLPRGALLLKTMPNNNHPNMRGGARKGAGRKPGAHTIASLIKIANSDQWVDDAVFEHIRGSFKLDEVEVRERFRILNECYGWFHIEHSQEGFPDFLLKNLSNELIRAEVEKKASDFKSHRHNIHGCDLIICWRNDWASCPIPILAISAEWFNYEQLKKVTPFLRIGKPL